MTSKDSPSILIKIFKGVRAMNAKKKTSPSRDFARKLVRLLEREFRPPFIHHRLVQTKLHPNGSAWIKIGHRDVDITATGQVTGAGTSL